MGCCCSQEDQRRKCGTIPTHRTEADSGGELLTRSEDLPAIATSFESHSRQEVRAFKEPRSVPEPQRSQRSVPSIDVDPLQRNPRRTPSQRTAEIQSNHNPKRSPSPMTPNTLNKESVKIELDELLDLGKTFVQQCFSHSSKSQSSKARKTIYQSVIENVVGKDNPKSREQIADEVENRWKNLNFPSPSRRRTDLLDICEKRERIKEKLNRDVGTWVFTWESEKGEELEFPNATRDKEPVYQGLLCEVDATIQTDNEEE